jgi:biotin transport system substrate-specific component
MASQRRPGIAALLLAAMACAVSSWVTIPLDPVPITVQTLAVTLTGALLGPWRGAAAVLIWLAAGGLGAPVLAGGTGGIDRFTGPGAGYLFAFPVAAWLVGVLADRGWMCRPPTAFAAMIAGNAICLAIGAAWLAMSIGPNAALMKGVVPFLIGALIKSLVGTAVVAAFRPRRRA